MPRPKSSKVVEPKPYKDTPFDCAEVNPFLGHYASLLYYANALFEPFIAVRRPGEKRESSYFDEWRKSPTVHTYVKWAIQHLVCLVCTATVLISPLSYLFLQIWFLESDPTAICDDPVVIRYAHSLSRILNILAVDEKFVYDASRDPWFIDVADYPDHTAVRAPLFSSPILPFTFF